MTVKEVVSFYFILKKGAFALFMAFWNESMKAYQNIKVNASGFVFMICQMDNSYLNENKFKKFKISFRSSIF